MENKILIAVPTRSRIHYKTADWLINQKANNGYSVVMCYSVFGVEAARTKLVSYFSKNDYTHLFFLDDDIEPPVDCIETLLKHDKDIITARYLTQLNGSITDIAPYMPILSQIDKCGLGACLIKRKVFSFSDLHKYFELEYKDGEVIEGEDYKFCRMAKKLGFEIWSDSSIICEHYKEVPIKQISERLMLI